MPVHEPTEINCPYCGEPIDVWVDVSGGSQSYVEDCQVCCRPIQLTIDIGSDGSAQVTAMSGDE